MVHCSPAKLQGSASDADHPYSESKQWVQGKQPNAKSQAYKFLHPEAPNGAAPVVDLWKGKDVQSGVKKEA